MEQYSDEWWNIRKLKLTGSNATAIMNNGKGLKTLVRDVMCEYYSSGAYEAYSNKYSNAHIERGHEYEDTASTIYELETGNKTQKVGCITFGDYVMVSPDRLVGDDGLLEIKNLSDKVFLDLAITGKVDSNHRNQMQMQLFVSGRKWVDYFAFCPNFNPCYFKKRFYPDLDDFTRIKEGIDSGTKLIQQEKAILDEMFKVGD